MCTLPKDEVERLRVVFEDPGLQRLDEDVSFAPERWGVDLVKAYRRKIQTLRAATDERDLYAMRSLHLGQLKGDRAGTLSIRLNDQSGLIVKFRTDNDGRKVIVVEMVDCH